MVALGLGGGAVANARDRRSLLLVTQSGLAAIGEGLPFAFSTPILTATRFRP